MTVDPAVICVSCKHRVTLCQYLSTFHFASLFPSLLMSCVDQQPGASFIPEPISFESLSKCQGDN